MSRRWLGRFTSLRRIQLVDYVAADYVVKNFIEEAYENFELDKINRYDIEPGDEVIAVRFTMEYFGKVRKVVREVESAWKADSPNENVILHHIYIGKDYNEVHDSSNEWCREDEWTFYRVPRRENESDEPSDTEKSSPENVGPSVPGNVNIQFDFLTSDQKKNATKDLYGLNDTATLDSIQDKVNEMMDRMAVITKYLT